VTFYRPLPADQHGHQPLGLVFGRRRLRPLVGYRFAPGPQRSARACSTSPGSEALTSASSIAARVNSGRNVSATPSARERPSPTRPLAPWISDALVVQAPPGGPELLSVSPGANWDILPSHSFNAHRPGEASAIVDRNLCKPLNRHEALRLQDDGAEEPNQDGPFGDAQGHGGGGSLARRPEPSWLRQPIGPGPRPPGAALDHTRRAIYRHLNMSS